MLMSPQMILGGEGRVDSLFLGPLDPDFLAYSVASDGRTCYRGGTQSQPQRLREPSRRGAGLCHWPLFEETTMLRKLAGSLVALALCVGITLAEEIRAVITKVDGDKVTFAELKGKDEKGPEKTLPATGAKVVKGKFNRDTKKLEAGEALDGGLKNEMFSKIGQTGVNATIVTDAAYQKITEFRVGGRRGQGKYFYRPGSRARRFHGGPFSSAPWPPEH